MAAHTCLWYSDTSQTISLNSQDWRWRLAWGLGLGVDINVDVLVTTSAFELDGDRWHRAQLLVQLQDAIRTLQGISINLIDYVSIAQAQLLEHASGTDGK